MPAAQLAFEEPGLETIGKESGAAVIHPCASNSLDRPLRQESKSRANAVVRWSCLLDCKSKRSPTADERVERPRGRAERMRELDAEPELPEDDVGARTNEFL